jgi:hypothetical protein
MTDRFRSLRDATVQAVLRGPAKTSPELRQAVAAGTPPAELRPLVDKIRSDPATVTDEDWVALRAAHDEEAQFEIVVAAVVGAAGERVAAALAALEGA